MRLGSIPLAEVSSQVSLQRAPVFFAENFSHFVFCTVLNHIGFSVNVHLSGPCVEPYLRMLLQGGLGHRTFPLCMCACSSVCWKMRGVDFYKPVHCFVVHTYHLLAMFPRTITHMLQCLARNSQQVCHVAICKHARP